jgi:hypothetical protein
VVVDHPLLTAFATINVGYPTSNQHIHMLRAYLVGKVTPGANALITQSDLPV